MFLKLDYVSHAIKPKTFKVCCCYMPPCMTCIQ